MKLIIRVVVTAVLVLGGGANADDREVAYTGKVVYLLGSVPVVGAKVRLHKTCDSASAEVARGFTGLTGDFRLTESVPAEARTRCLRVLTNQARTTKPLDVPADRDEAKAGTITISKGKDVDVKAAQAFALEIADAPADVKAVAFQDLNRLFDDSDPKTWARVDFVKSAATRKFLESLCTEAQCSTTYKTRLDAALVAAEEKDQKQYKVSPLNK